MDQKYADLSSEALKIISAAEQQIAQTTGSSEKIALVAYRAEH